MGDDHTPDPQQIEKSLERRWLPGVGALTFAPRLLFSALGDLRSIAESTRALPEVAARLAVIQDQVEELNGEVTRMRKGVDAVGGETKEMRAGVDRIEPALDELRGALHPLSRAADVFRRRGSRTDEEEVAGADQ